MADQNEIKKLLDDPNVTPETKKQLVGALAGAGASEEDVKKYAEANGVEVPHDPGVGEHIVGGLLAPVTGGLTIAENIDDEAKRAAFTKEGAEADKIVKKAGEERELGSTQKVLNETGDFKTSDELLDAGAPGLRFFEKFIPVYQKAAPVCGHNGQAPDLKGYIYKNYDEVREIDFGKFREDADKINKAGTELDNHQNEMTRAWGGLSSWEGDASNRARAFNDKFNGAATGFIEDTQKSPGTITGFASSAQKKVKEFAQHVHDQYSEKCGGMTVEEAEEAIRHAKGDIFENDGGILDWLTGVPSGIVGVIGGALCGGIVPGILAAVGWDSWVGDVREKIIQQAKDKLKGLCQEFDSKKQAFDNYCKAVQDGVNADYNTMFSQLEGQIKDKPFGQVGDPPSFTEDPGGKGKAKQPPDGPGGGPGGGGPGGGGPGGGGPGGGGTPEIPKPENPLDKDGDGKPDVPGDTDGDGKPDDLDGDGKPDQPKPEKELETVTVKSGDNTIKITEPDSNGHVKMTIDTPKGEPKTYDLDFSKNPEAAKALMSQNGAGAIAGLASQVQSSQAPGAPSPNTPPGGSGPGGSGGTPTPGGGGAPGSGAAIPVEVGPDGKIHIEQDGINFTAEVNPETGEIGLTIDDGDGTPDQIGVEFGEDENDTGTSGSVGGGGDLPPLTPDAGLPDAAFPDAREDVTTMPAPADGMPEADQSGPIAPPAAFEDMRAAGAGESGMIPPPAAYENMQPSGQGGMIPPPPAFENMQPSGQGGMIPPPPAFENMQPSGQGGMIPPPPAFENMQPSGGGQWTTMPAQGENPWSAPGGRSYIEDNGIMPSVGHASDSTSTSGVSLGGSSAGGGDSVLGGSLGGGSSSAVGSDSAWTSPEANAADSGTQFGTNTSEAGQAGQATLPSMQDGHGQQSGGAAPGGMMGGGMMGGAPPAGGAGGGQGGGDTERGPSQWRTTGSLFDDDSALSRVQGVLGDDRGGH